MPTVSRSTRTTTTTTIPPSNGARLVAADGRILPLTAMRLSAEAGSGLCRVRLEQTFTNPHREPLAVTYLLPLPADGAVSAFAFRIGERRIAGEIDRREAARERFEEALASGRTAALLEQDRSSVFTQEIGNIPPGAQVVAEIAVDQPLSWTGDGGWEWRFPTTVAPRYRGAPDRVADGERVTVDVADADLPPRLRVELAIRDPLAPGGAPASPSHRVVPAENGRGLVVTLRPEGEPGPDTGHCGDALRLDRDVVVRWPVALPEPGASLVTARPPADRAHSGSAYGLCTLVPPAAAEPEAALPRDVVVLIDTSGSMTGEPLAQATRIVTAIVDSLGERDRLEMVEFSTKPRRFHKRPVPMTESGRQDARAWIAGLQAGGGTEMRTAILAALEPLGDEAQRQIVLCTDGLIGFEQDIVAEIRTRLPRASRVHTVGVGSAVNRSLTGAAARAGGGVEVIVGLGEDPVAAARRIVARTTAPLVVDLEVSGPALLTRAPERLPDLFGRAPALLALELRPEGGQLTVRGRTPTGTFERALDVPPTAPGTGPGEIVARFGREKVEDLELELATGAAAPAVEHRIEEIGLAFQIATRRTSWVAVATEPGVDPTAPMRRERIPHELPHGMSVEGLGLRAPAGVGGDAMTAEACSATMLLDLPIAVSPAPKRTAAAHGLGARLFGRMFGRGRDGGEAPPVPLVPRARDQRRLSGRVVLRRGVELVVEIDSDGFDWRLPDAVECWFGGVRSVRAEVDRARTTRDGFVPAGQRIRLSLRLSDGAAAEAPDSLRLELETSGALVVVELR